MAVASPISERSTIVALMLLTVATGIVDAISLLILGHVFVANMTGNTIFPRFVFIPWAGVDLTAAATLSRITIAPASALAAAVVAVSLSIFRFGPAAQAQPLR